MQLVWPSSTYLPGYIHALKRGWSSGNLRPEAAQEAREHVLRNPSGFVAEQVDLEGKGPPITLSDGTTVPRLPGYHRWIWDGEFCGDISFRWQPGTTELPPTCLGHIGYSVVPWKQGRGYATKALAILLLEIREHGLPFVELTADPANVASQKVIEANGGTLVERFNKPAVHGGTESLRFRIYFERSASNG